MRISAWLASLVHYIAAPGVVIGLIPWMLTGWETDSPTWAVVVRAFGAVMVVGGVAVVSAEFVRFVREGGGSPAPVAPTQRLVTGGLYRFVRNPMYVGVISAILGQALLFSSSVLLAYAGVVTITVAAFVRGYEEPTLRRTYGAQYETYCAQVPPWIPRLPRHQRRSSAR